MNYNYLKRINVIRILLGGSSIGLALGFIKFWNRWVFFTVFPNILDVTLGVSIGCALIIEALWDVKLNTNLEEFQSE